jgi:hypothetical protein
MRKLILLLMITALLTPMTALAQGAGGYVNYHYSDDAGSGIGVGARYALELAPPAALDFRASWYHCGDIDLDVIPLEAALLVRFVENEDVRPYVGVGVGYYLTEGNRGDVDDDPGWFALAGIEYEARPDWSWFGELQWTGLEPDVDDEFDAKEDTGSSVELGGIGLNAGLVVRW